MLATAKTGRFDDAAQWTQYSSGLGNRGLRSLLASSTPWTIWEESCARQPGPGGLTPRRPWPRSTRDLANPGTGSPRRSGLAALFPVQSALADSRALQVPTGLRCRAFEEPRHPARQARL